MEEYHGIPVFEYDSSLEKSGKKLFRFKNMIPIVVPANVGYAFVEKNREYVGIIVSDNGNREFRKDSFERIFIRTCPSFIGCMPNRTTNCIEARI